MRICFVVSRFPAASHTFIFHDAEGLAARGHEVTVLAFSGDAQAVPEATPAGGRLRVVYLEEPKSRGRAIAILVGGLWRLIRRGDLRHAQQVIVAALTPAGAARREALWMAGFALQGPQDLVHYQFANLVKRVDHIREAVWPDVPVVATFRGADLGIPYHHGDVGFFNEVARRCDLILCVSRDLRRRLLETAPGAAPKALVQRSAIRWPAAESVAGSLRDGRVVQILSVGRLVPKKGFCDGVRAVAHLHELTDLPLQYTVVGDGPLRKEIAAVAERVGLSQQVVLTGVLPSSAVHERMCKADVLLVPSITAEDGDIEGVPNVIKEAMSVGLPVVATDSGGTAELVVDGVSGRLCRERDWDAMAAALADVLSKPGAARRMAHTGQLMVREEFEGEKLLDDLLCRYRSVVEGYQPKRNVRSLASEAPNPGIPQRIRNRGEPE